MPMQMPRVPITGAEDIVTMRGRHLHTGASGGCGQRQRPAAAALLHDWHSISHASSDSTSNYEVADSSFRDPVFGSLGKIS